MKRKGTKSPIKRILKAVDCVLICLLLLVALGLGVLTILEWRPKDTEEVSLDGAGTRKEISAGDELTVMIWNVGYGALGDNADFFMDGGTMVETASEQRVRENMKGITETMARISPDILFVQEIDRHSARSHFIDESVILRDTFPEMTSSFANNFRAVYVPYPIPPIGQVDSGLLTMTSLDAASARRVQLPVPFSWPIRMANLKRCLLITRVPVQGTEKELVLINLHLEAYDDGTGKTLQTAMLKEIMQQEVSQGNYVIAGGDFNQLFSSVDAGLYPVREGMWTPGIIDVSDFGDSFRCLADAGVPTCRSLDQPYAGADAAGFQFYMIDGFIVSDHIQVQSLQTLDEQFVFTDHNPVVMRFVLE